MRPRPRLVPLVRPVPQVYRPGRRVSPKRERGLWSWRPDSWVERADAWFWAHPKTHALVVAVIFSLMVLACLWCAFVARGTS